MGDSSASSDQVIEKLSKMGFQHSIIIEAVKAVGPSVHDAAEYILNVLSRNCEVVSTSSITPSSNRNALCKVAASSTHPCRKVRQSCILDHFQSAGRAKRTATVVPDVKVSKTEVLSSPVNDHKVSLPVFCPSPESFPVSHHQELHVELDWEERVKCLLQKHFGYSALKSFQKEALAAWLAHQDCLVLAATGSGKSLCFQIPALLTGKVVVVISPLISLMHDQCLRLSKHGVSACFLGSGQPDSTVEHKAMRGMYDIIYVCPETVLRLIKPLQRLAEGRGIALFAIDEVHCVSKWGHDFRPDYRKLSVLRESFCTNKLKFLTYDVPLMALTATATVCVREDIIKSLCMSKETKIVLTSFFRPNLWFSVKHSPTSRPSSYRKDFCELIDIYTKRRKDPNKCGNLSRTLEDSSGHSFSPTDSGVSDIDMNGTEYDYSDGDSDDKNPSKARQLSVEYLEDETDILHSVDDWDVAFGEFCGQPPGDYQAICRPFEMIDPPVDPEERLRFRQQPLEDGPTIIYVPTRKETLRIAKYLSSFGVKAAAYNAGLAKSHLRRVHKEFQDGILEVVVATIAFGMGIDKLNVRRIIHYGWPQSLEAYYQEAGRAGRDGKLAECILHADLSKIPTLLPSQRSEDQTKQAYKMLSDCFRYGINTSCCRAKLLVEYFGEDFGNEGCLMCDVCVNGPPEMQDVKEEAEIFMQVIMASYKQSRLAYDFYDNITYDEDRQQNTVKRPHLRVLVSKIREQSQNFMATDLLWWRGLARILESKGYLREGDHKSHVQIKFPELTECGLQFLQSKLGRPFYVYPEADMLLSMRNKKSFSSFSEWGKGWADTEIRKERLKRIRSERKSRDRGPQRRAKKRNKPDMGTARGRITSKLSLQKTFR